MSYALISNQHYKQISSNYETMKLINEEFDNILESYMSASKANESQVISEFLRLVYTENFLLQRSPRWFIVLQQNNDSVEGSVYGRGIEEIGCFSERNEDIKSYILKVTETGMYLNYSSHALSDINSIEQLIPTFVLRYLGQHYLDFVPAKVETITSFGINNTLYIATGYIDKVNSYDLVTFNNQSD